MFKSILGKAFIFLLSFVILLSLRSALSPAQTKKVQVPAQNSFLGVFREGAPRNMAPIHEFEKLAGRKPAMIMWYADWSGPFPKMEANNVKKYGAVPHIVWEPWIWGKEDAIHLDDILRGKWNNYIERWAKEAKEYGDPIFLRFAHEFNIEKYPWGLLNNGKDPDKYIRTWKHVHKIFQNAGARNVRWIWCFNNYPNPNEPWNDYRKAYPCSEYVDWIGIDAYNWGLTQPWSGWETFSVMARDQARDAWLTYRKPIMLAEFGSTEIGGDKAQWIEDIPMSLKVSMRPVRAIVWFDIKKEADWRVNSSAKAAKAFQNIMKDSHFRGTGEQLGALTEPPPAQTVPIKKRTRAQEANRSIQIDAELSEWKGIEWILLAHPSTFAEGTRWDGPNDSSGEIALQWDGDALYLAARVQDDKPIMNLKRRKFVWDGDAFEVTLSVDPRANPDRKEFAATDFQIGLSTGNGNTNPPTIWIWQKDGPAEGGEIKVEATHEPKGYVLEAKIPWGAFGRYRPRRGEILGFNIALDDGDGGGRKSQLVWAGDFAFYRDPSVWGELEFSGKEDMQ